ncbi:MAG: PAS domain-containing protein [Dehalococcoidia bacterium]|nr:PAS domain-containing protein [Dehalococcoidia bacterium]
MSATQIDAFSSLFIDSARCPMFVVNSEGRILRSNRRAAQKLGRRKSDLRGKELSEVVRVTGDERWPFNSSGADVIPGVASRNGALLTLAGDPLQVELMVQAVDRQQSPRYLILAKEKIVECDLASAQEVRLREISEAQERERQRIARELHDEALQGLLVAGIEVERLIHDSASKKRLSSQSLQSLRELLRVVEDDVRQISGRMRSDTVPHCGLLDAVSNCVQSLQLRGLDADLRFWGAPVPVDPNIQILAYRIVQEALLNVTRHSGATRVRITVTCRNERLRIRVTDNGRGFTVPTALVSHGPLEYLGIKGMYERASLMNASLFIGSRSDLGTSVILRIPIESPG